jgi:decaprenylphospho-beta-D-ribofuranose 2-oxidase
MGLTGVVIDAAVEMLKVESDRVLVDTDRFANLDDLMSAMVSADDKYRYSVSWVDCMTKGASVGRGILTCR